MGTLTGQRGSMGAVRKDLHLSGHTILGLCPTNSAQILVLGRAILKTEHHTHAVTSEYNICVCVYYIYVYRFPRSNSALKRVRSTQLTTPGHSACVLKIKNRYTHECRLV